MTKHLVNIRIISPLHFSKILHSMSGLDEWRVDMRPSDFESGGVPLSVGVDASGEPLWNIYPPVKLTGHSTWEFLTRGKGWKPIGNQSFSEAFAVSFRELYLEVQVDH